MMHEYIDKINEVIMESQIKTCDSIIDLIDKLETIMEHDTDSATCDVVTESMSLFMEYVSKDKDEITKWMAKNGHWYEGDNPKKKKECMRMYHFLQQHDFHPSDGTYRSDIDDGKGGKKRIKLNIDKDPRLNLDKDDAKFLKSIKSKKDDELSESDKQRRGELSEKMSLDNVVLQGKNAYYDPYSKSINMGSKELKGKQVGSQNTLKHEEGHADSDLRRTGPFNLPANMRLPNDHPANIALRKHKASGKYVNSHDDSTEELMADLYAAMNGSIRTKNWGKNKTTRKFTKNDIRRSFNKLLKDTSEVLKIQEYYQRLIKWHDVYVNGVPDMICSKECMEKLSTLDQQEIPKYISKKIIEESSKRNFDKVVGKFSDAESEKASAKISDMRKNAKQSKEKIKRLNNILKDIIKIHDMYKDEPWFNMSTLETQVSDRSDKEEIMIISDIFWFATDIHEVLNTINNIKENDIMNIRDISDSIKSGNRYYVSFHNSVIMAVDEYKKKKRVSTQTKNHMKKAFIDLTDSNDVKDWNSIRKQSVDFDKCQKETKELRIKYSSSYIKEYFDEVFDGWMCYVD